MTRVALQMSGHLRGLCDSDANFAPLKQLVVACRAVASRCDLFVHTWDELYPQTSTWHTWYPSDNPNVAARSLDCVKRLKRQLKPKVVTVENQPMPSATLGNHTWIVATGRHRETHVSMAGLRSAIRGVAAVAELRRSHELASRMPQYDVALRLRPDLYHRRNFRRSTRSDYRGVPVNQICSVPERAWHVIAGNLRDSRSGRSNDCGGTACVRGCDDETAPGNKSGDMCFWSSPPTSMDRLVAAWDRLSDEYLEANLCWQRWRAQQLVQRPGVSGRGGRVPSSRASRLGSGHHDAIYRALSRSNGEAREKAPCAHAETQVEGSAAELMLTAAASREGLLRMPLHGEQPPRPESFVSRSAQCT